MNAVDILKYGQQTALQAVADFPASQWETAGACGAWSIKDIVAHLASYEEVLVDILAGFLGSAATPHLDRFTHSENFNDAEVGERRSQSSEQVLKSLSTAHAQVMDLAARISPEVYREVGTIPWYGADYSLDDLLVYMYYGHKREHSAQIAAFKDRL
jgi:uncharacterized damage-inducible protein DinB